MCRSLLRLARLRNVQVSGLEYHYIKSTMRRTFENILTMRTYLLYVQAGEDGMSGQEGPLSLLAFMGPVVDRYGRRCVPTPPFLVQFYISSSLAAASAAAFPPLSQRHSWLLRILCTISVSSALLLSL